MAICDLPKPFFIAAGAVIVVFSPSIPKQGNYSCKGLLRDFSVLGACTYEVTSEPAGTAGAIKAKRPGSVKTPMGVHQRREREINAHPGQALSPGRLENNPPPTRTHAVNDRRRSRCVIGGIDR